jgi:hypothetical protein
MAKEIRHEVDHASVLSPIVSGRFPSLTTHEMRLGVARHALRKLPSRMSSETVPFRV